MLIYCFKRNTMLVNLHKNYIPQRFTEFFHGVLWNRHSNPGECQKIHFLRLQEKSFPWKVIPEKSYPENSYPLKIHTLKSHTLKIHSLSEAIIYYYKFAINLVKIHNMLDFVYKICDVNTFWELILRFFYKYLIIIIISKRGWVFRVWVFRGYEFSGYEFSVYQFSGNQFRGNDFSCSPDYTI